MYEVSRGVQSSGRLKNSGKRFVLQLAANEVRYVSLKRDEGGVCYGRKEMIRCSFYLNLNGMWGKNIESRGK